MTIHCLIIKIIVSWDLACVIFLCVSSKYGGGGVTSHPFHPLDPPLQDPVKINLVRWRKLPQFTIIPTLFHSETQNTRCVTSDQNKHLKTHAYSAYFAVCRKSTSIHSVSH